MYAIWPWLSYACRPRRRSHRSRPAAARVIISLRAGVPVHIKRPSTSNVHLCLHIQHSSTNQTSVYIKRPSTGGCQPRLRSRRSRPAAARAIVSLRAGVSVQIKRPSTSNIHLCTRIKRPSTNHTSIYVKRPSTDGCRPRQRSRRSRPAAAHKTNLGVDGRLIGNEAPALTLIMTHGRVMKYI